MRALFKKAAAAKEPVDINEIIQEVLAITQVELQRNRVSLRTECAEDLPMVIGDKIQLQQVILNLVVNAIEAMSGVSDGPREMCVSSQRVSDIPGEAGTNAVEGNTPIARKLRKILDFPKGILRLSGDTGAFEQFFGLLDDILHPSRLSRWFRMPPAGRLQRKPNRPKNQVAL